jgi:glycosyltransferase involved in cell wall biosynthesis
MKRELKSMLIVGPYFPRKCGLASHTYQLSKSLEAKGVKINTLAPLDCNSTYNLNLIGGFRFLQILKFNKYDKINVHFVPEEYFYTGFSLKRFLNIFPLISFLIVFLKMRNIRVVIHEPPWTKYFFQKSFLWKYLWKKVPEISFFTERECLLFQKKMDIKLNKNQVIIENVFKDFKVFSNSNIAESRLELNISKDKTIFLCIGFVNYLKGFDKVAELFKINKFSNCELYIVGSVRLESDKSSINYFDNLKNSYQNVTNVTIIDSYLSYEDFDLWMIASDYIIFPYREISNSGVLGRAHILNKRSIVRDVGGLKNQLNKNDQLYETNNQLGILINKINLKNRT